MRQPLVLVVLAVLAAPTTATGFDVTDCYMTVPDGETGVLIGNLACDGSGGPNVSLGRRARLELNGHTISGGYIGVATAPGHTGGGEIVGPGEIVGASGDPLGCAISAASRVVVRDVTLHLNRRGIVSVYDFSMKLRNVTIMDNEAEGIASYFGNLGGDTGPGNGKIAGRNLAVIGNGDNGIESYGDLSLRDSSIAGNGGAGIVSKGRRYVLEDVTVAANVGAGVLSTSTKRGTLKDSSVANNGPDGDIAAPVAPKLIRSTCGTSVDTHVPGTLGVCADD